MALNEIFDYFQGYDPETYSVFACQGNEPCEEDLLAFEREAGFKLPDEFREFTKSPLGGLYMEVREELWPRAEAFATGPAWAFQYGVCVYGIAASIPPWMDLRHLYREFREMGQGHLVPFLSVIGDADRYCFDREGGILRWLHEEPSDPEPVDGTFSELLMREIDELERRKERKLSPEA